MYDTDQEQIEAIQAWWSKNGNWVIAGFIVFFAAYIGIHLYQNASKNHRIEASEIYDELTLNLASENGDMEEAEALINQLKADYSDLGYGAMAALLQAKTAVEAEDYSLALSELDWALENADDSLKSLVLYRKAQVLYADDQLDDALTALGQIEGEGHEAVSYELKGDILLDQGKIDEARAAYQTANDLNAEQGINNAYLKIKLDDLAVAE